jgi:hypothetical protein
MHPPSVKTSIDHDESGYGFRHATPLPLPYAANKCLARFGCRNDVLDDDYARRR